MAVRIWSDFHLRSAPGASPPLEVSFPSTSACTPDAIAIVMPTAVSAGRALRVTICALMNPLENAKRGRLALTDLAVKILLKFIITPSQEAR